MMIRNFLLKTVTLIPLLFASSSNADYYQCQAYCLLGQYDESNFSMFVREIEPIDGDTQYFSKEQLFEILRQSCSPPESGMEAFDLYDGLEVRNSLQSYTPPKPTVQKRVWSTDNLNTLKGRLPSVSYFDQEKKDFLYRTESFTGETAGSSATFPRRTSRVSHYSDSYRSEHISGNQYFIGSSQMEARWWRATPHTSCRFIREETVEGQPPRFPKPYGYGIIDGRWDIRWH
jgi:hypothetical protein